MNRGDLINYFSDISNILKYRLNSEDNSKLVLCITISSGYQILLGLLGLNERDCAFSKIYSQLPKCGIKRNSNCLKACLSLRNNIAHTNDFMKSVNKLCMYSLEDYTKELDILVDRYEQNISKFPFEIPIENTITAKEMKDFIEDKGIATDITSNSSTNKMNLF